MSNLREELLHQHAWLDQALNDLGCAAEAADNTVLLGAWSELERTLLRHLDFEEQELFPLVAPFHAKGLDALRDEHDRIRKLVTDLGVRADLHALRKDTVDELVETLRRHAEHEDRTLYHWIEEHAPEDTRRHLLSLFAKTARADVRSSSS
jgi:hemerythrin-like domain-containing protein